LTRGSCKKKELLQVLLKTSLAMVERPAKSREGWGLFISGLPNEDLGDLSTLCGFGGIFVCNIYDVIGFG